MNRKMLPLPSASHLTSSPHLLSFFLVSLLVAAVNSLGDVRILIAHADAEADVSGAVLVAESVDDIVLKLVNLLALLGSKGGRK